MGKQTTDEKMKKHGQANKKQIVPGKLIEEEIGMKENEKKELDKTKNKEHKTIMVE